MFESLYSKTFAILGSQLIITWGVTVLVIQKVRQMYYNRVPGVSAITKSNGQLDLDLDWERIKPYFYALLIADIVVFIFLLLSGQEDIVLGITLFSIWSVLTGIELALALISVDENMGGKVLGLTATITVLCGLTGVYSGIDFGFLSGFLFFGLLFLIIGNGVRILLGIDNMFRRIMALFGVFIFIGYLLFDFNRLEKLDTLGSNSWGTAMNMSIEIYLDIINLFLELLDLLSD